jgi:hypothetical protein
MRLIALLILFSLFSLSTALMAGNVPLDVADLSWALLP